MDNQPHCPICYGVANEPEPGSLHYLCFCQSMDQTALGELLVKLELRIRNGTRPPPPRYPPCQECGDVPDPNPKWEQKRIELEM